LFTFFVSGLVAMIERAGGIAGIVKDLNRYVSTPRKAMLVTFVAGLAVFFDDYVSVLVVGRMMPAMTDLLHVSREKVAFLVDSTAAPVASLNPVSSWIGFEIGLIQTEIDKIVKLEGTSDLAIVTNGFQAFLKTFKYRYYPLFMLLLVVMLIVSGRDFGPMLIAERKTQAYRRTDGGDGKMYIRGGVESRILPRANTPERSWNTWVPIGFLLGFILYFFYTTVKSEKGEEDFSDTYAALIWSTVATACATQAFYLFQYHKDGQIVSFTENWSRDETEIEMKPVPEAVEDTTGQGKGEELNKAAERKITSPSKAKEWRLLSPTKSMEMKWSSPSNAKERRLMSPTKSMEMKRSSPSATMEGKLTPSPSNSPSKKKGASTSPTRGSSPSRRNDFDMQMEQSFSEIGFEVAEHLSFHYDDTVESPQIAPPETPRIGSSNAAKHKPDSPATIGFEKIYKPPKTNRPPVRVLLNVSDGAESFLNGMVRIFPAIIILTLAWAASALITAVGTERLFSRLIKSDDFAPEMMPTLAFLLSLMLASATGTSWGTMAIVFPLITVPTYEASGGDPEIFYSTMAGILSGAVAGDHVSPLSDTTLLTVLTTDCGLFAHVSTQTPYIAWVCIVSILVGTFPIGSDTYQVGVAYLLAVLAMLFFVFFLCAKIIDPKGRFDPMTEVYLYWNSSSDLHQLKKDTAKAYLVLEAERIAKEIQKEENRAEKEEEKRARMLVQAQEKGAATRTIDHGGESTDEETIPSDDGNGKRKSTKLQEDLTGPSTSFLASSVIASYTDTIEASVLDDATTDFTLDEEGSSVYRSGKRGEWTHALRDLYGEFGRSVDEGFLGQFFEEEESEMETQATPLYSGVNRTFTNQNSCSTGSESGRESSTVGSSVIVEEDETTCVSKKLTGAQPSFEVRTTNTSQNSSEDNSQRAGSSPAASHKTVLPPTLSPRKAGVSPRLSPHKAGVSPKSSPTKLSPRKTIVSPRLSLFKAVVSPRVLSSTKRTPSSPVSRSYVDGESEEDTFAGEELTYAATSQTEDRTRRTEASHSEMMSEIGSELGTEATFASLMDEDDADIEYPPRLPRDPTPRANLPAKAPTPRGPGGGPRDPTPRARANLPLRPGRPPIAPPATAFGVTPVARGGGAAYSIMSVGTESVDTFGVPFKAKEAQEKETKSKPQMTTTRCDKFVF
jgi:Na+/H+ antiporter NhaC